MKKTFRPQRGTRRAFLAATVTITTLGAGLLPGTERGAAYADDWTQYRGDVTRRGVSSEKVTTPLSLLWRYSAGAQALNACAPVVVKDTAYFAARGTGEGGVLYALDVNTGSRKWQYPWDANGLPNKTVFLTSPLIDKGKVYIGASDGGLYVIDAATGELKNKFRTGRAIGGAPAIVDGTLYFGSDDGTFYVIDPNTGAQVWKTLYKAGAPINSAPVMTEDMVFFTSDDNSVHGIKKATGSFRWKQRLPYRLPNDPLVYADNTLYAPSGQRLYALQPATGIPRWQADFTSDILTAPVADNGLVYVMCKNPKGGSTLFAIRGNNGKAAWKQAVNLPLTPSAPPTLAGDVLLIPTSKNALMAVSREDGKLLWEYYLALTANRPRPEDEAGPEVISVMAAAVTPLAGAAAGADSLAVLVAFPAGAAAFPAVPVAFPAAAGHPLALAGGGEPVWRR